MGALVVGVGIVTGVDVMETWIEVELDDDDDGVGGYGIEFDVVGRRIAVDDLWDSSGVS